MNSLGFAVSVFLSVMWIPSSNRGEIQLGDKEHCLFVVDSSDWPADDRSDRDPILNA